MAIIDDSVVGRSWKNHSNCTARNIRHRKNHCQPTIDHGVCDLGPQGSHRLHDSSPMLVLSDLGSDDTTICYGSRWTAREATRDLVHGADVVDSTGLHVLHGGNAHRAVRQEGT